MEEELGRVLVEATAALSRLDAAALADLERRACALRDALAGETSGERKPESAAKLSARFRVFADVVTATGKDLAMLKRVGMSKLGGVQEEAGVLWVR